MSANRFTGLGLPKTRTYWHRLDDPARLTPKTRSQPWWKGFTAKRWRPTAAQYRAGQKESVFDARTGGFLTAKPAKPFLPQLQNVLRGSVFSVFSPV
jgi:hypothetical protein